jgi:hypothetical protein
VSRARDNAGRGRKLPAGKPAAIEAADAVLCAVTTGSVQDMALDKLRRELSATELEGIAQKLTFAAGEALDTFLGWLPAKPVVDELDELLRNRHQIAHVWDIGDVRDVRPDLTEDQAWSVLQLIDRQKDASLGITWETLEAAAASLFPQEENAEGGDA